ncbi:phage protein [Komagataeibacter europaeus NBRC 3261]|uniref:Phage protein n=1 Tax=Komagataeibacter europaeus NBRC 3261 TaxID=1234669 RepID=A0A0D6PWP5_KOMEU|nr:YdaS family helix-turn-helix protein [Komagataeibacter europaeus]GAN95458.1 phage protein [Komagataeibacter europaeus NBRC 3261]
MDVRNIIRAAGGPSRIGEAIGKTHSAVCRWKKVPSVHVLTVASLSGISPHAIRPDVFGPEPQQSTAPWWELPDGYTGQRGAA